mgnify:CR=1 FL=1
MLLILRTELLPLNSSIAVRKSPSRTWAVITTTSALSSARAAFWMICATLTPYFAKHSGHLSQHTATVLYDQPHGNNDCGCSAIFFTGISL